MTSGAPSGGTVALDSTYTQGVTPTYSGAPATPTGMLTIANYPALDVVPPVNSPEVQEWLSKIDLTNVPSYGPTTGDVSTRSLRSPENIADYHSVPPTRELSLTVDVGGPVVDAVSFTYVDREASAQG